MKQITLLYLFINHHLKMKFPFQTSPSLLPTQSSLFNAMPSQLSQYLLTSYVSSVLRAQEPPTLTQRQCPSSHSQGCWSCFRFRGRQLAHGQPEHPRYLSAKLTASQAWLVYGVLLPKVRDHTFPFELCKGL